MKVKTVHEHTGRLTALLRAYRYQPDLTAILDCLKGEIDEARVNEIVLWKVNRYASLRSATLSSLNDLRSLRGGSHRKGEPCLRLLLGEQMGVRLPMASTFLRFRNPRAFQIIDRRAYRALYGTKLPSFSRAKIDSAVHMYFRYIDDLRALARKRMVRFQDLDRILYVFDKTENKTLSK
jgi:hypothetical protein